MKLFKAFFWFAVLFGLTLISPYLNTWVYLIPALYSSYKIFKIVNAPRCC